MGQWFGATWDTIGFVALSTVAMYVTLLAAVRLAGRRTIAQLGSSCGMATCACRPGSGARS
jgi:hypothetical protein